MSIWRIAVRFKCHGHIRNLSYALNDDSGQFKKKKKKEKIGKEEVVVEGWLSQVTSPSNKDTFSH